MLDHNETIILFAGGTQGLGLPLAERLTDAGCTRQVIRGPFFALQRFAPSAEKGQPAAAVKIAPHSGSKAALANMTKNVAKAPRGRGIRVNGINCG